MRRLLVAALAVTALAAPAAADAAQQQTFTTSQSPFTEGLRNQGTFKDEFYGFPLTRTAIWPALART